MFAHLESNAKLIAEAPIAVKRQAEDLAPWGDISYNIATL